MHAIVSIHVQPSSLSDKFHYQLQITANKKLLSFMCQTPLLLPSLLDRVLFSSF
jgi:hypothetical protein